MGKSFSRGKRESRSLARHLQNHKCHGGSGGGGGSKDCDNADEDGWTDGLTGPAAAPVRKKR